MEKQANSPEKELSALREKMKELKKNIILPDFVSKFRDVRTRAMDIYRRNPNLITKDDLTLFGIIVKKEKA